MPVFTFVESPELFVESVLGLHGDGDDIRGLPLSPSSQDQMGAAAVAVVPGGLNEEPSGVDVTGFGDGASSLAISRRAFGWHQAEVGHE